MQQENKDSQIILGIDPGTRICGYGLIKKRGLAYSALDYGCIRPPSNFKLTDRYFIIFESVSALIDQFHPQAVVIETQYAQKNIQSAIKLGMARGVAITAAKAKKLSVYEYSPTKAKKAVVGFGNASKYQVKGMIIRLLNLPENSMIPEDAADALALAICFGQSFQNLSNTQEI